MVILDDLGDLDLEDLLKCVVELSAEEEEPNFLFFWRLCEYMRATKA